MTIVTDLLSTASVGDTVTFTVTATGVPAITTYNWTKSDDGGNVWHPISAGGAGMDTPTLTLANVTSGTAGLFRCTVTNAVGSVISTPAELIINIP